MTINVHGYAAPSVKAALTPYQVERRDIRDDDVVIDMFCPNFSSIILDFGTVVTYNNNYK